MNATVVSTAGIGSHPRVDARAAADLMLDDRRSLVHMAFPYLEETENPRKDVDYDAYFDELDALEEERKRASEAADKVGDEGAK